jgi:hypothetical protein
VGPPANFSCFRSSPDSGAALAAAFATPTLEIAGSVHLPALAQAAVVFIKASERRSLLNGANAQSHIHHVMNANPPPDVRGSTQIVLDELDALCGITDREKELRDKDVLSDDEARELVAIEDAREQERQRQYQNNRQRKLAAKA